MDLVLNISADEPAVTKSNSKKGGRWTDRLKAKRVAKRKSHPAEESSDLPPTKKPRVSLPEKLVISPRDLPTSRPPGQIISSLFTANPKFDAPTKTVPTPAAAPSNAPSVGSSFQELGLNPLLASHLANKLGISTPTSIQRAALTAALPSESSDRDIFIQSQTGSGKTLSFLLPIIQDLLPLSTLSYIDRSIGTLAIIIAPTRELATQISEVLESLLKLRLRAEDESAEDGNAARLTRWLVSGLLIGGATRSHEKARLRKGVPILVSTPGRLLDHLQNTSSFNAGKCRWLVLDEADRLMELGFEESITGILKGLEGRRKLALQAVEQGIGSEVGGWDWSRKRRTILCSATIREDVQKLAGMMLKEPVIIKATEVDKTSLNPFPSSTSEKFTPPSQLAQKYVIVPLKLRLVVLVALLRLLIAQNKTKIPSKIIVFLSCTDSVDFHWNLLAGINMDTEPAASDSSEEDSAAVKPPEKLELQSALLPDTSIFRLHGSLPTQTRLASVKKFSNPSTQNSSVLFCTSVASRGLDLPLVRAVVQYDLPTEGGATEYVHRVGRTARAGKGGEAWSIIAPNEKAWVDWIKSSMAGTSKTSSGKSDNITLTGITLETLLQAGFGGKESEYEGRATDVQLSFERWVLRRKQNTELAQQAYLSYMRAYSTHPTEEKHIFHVKHLHLGHLAKSFALRDAPNSVANASRKSTGKGRKPNNGEGLQVPAAEKRMQEVVRQQGRLSKKGGVMLSSGAADFQIASLEDYQ